MRNDHLDVTARVAATAAEDWYYASCRYERNDYIEHVRAAKEGLRAAIHAWSAAGGAGLLLPRGYESYIPSETGPAERLRRQQLVVVHAARDWLNDPSPATESALDEACAGMLRAQTTLRHTRSGRA